MMLTSMSSDLKQLFLKNINDLVTKGRKSYEDLTFEEKRMFVVAFLKDEEFSLNECILTDADNIDNPQLSALVGAIIETAGNISSIKNFYDKIIERFINGTDEQPAYLASCIDKAFEDEIYRRSDPVNYYQEALDDDNRQRAQDLKSEMNNGDNKTWQF